MRANGFLHLRCTGAACGHDILQGVGEPVMGGTASAIPATAE
jgi:hypothetical protein